MANTEYVYYGNRAPEDHNAMLVAEVESHMILFWWTGYVTGNAVKLYPRKYAVKYHDGKKRAPFTMAMRDLIFKEQKWNQ